jgi:hypothetical protein
MGKKYSKHRAEDEAYMVLVEKPEGRKPLGKSRRRCEDNIKMDRREKGWDVMDWVTLAQDGGQWRDLVNTVMDFRSHTILGFLSKRAPGGFSSRTQLHGVSSVQQETQNPVLTLGVCLVV